MSIRCTSKAIILHNGKILLNKCFDKNNGAYFSLPGGGQNIYESLSEAVTRECLDETGYTVSPVRFAAVCEEICDNKDVREKYPDYSHKIYHIFVCDLLSENKRAPTEKDDMQIESEWVNVSQLNKICLLPKVIGDNIQKMISNDVPLFLGSEHIRYNHG